MITEWRSAGEGVLRAPPSADPPLNMKKGLIFNGVFVLATSCTVVLIRGKQARKELDEEKLRAQVAAVEVS
jgi:MFS transporter, FLVCR family, MFS-domain-containing protein 7